ncbi:AAA family ATPase, partial [Escherichia coli]
LRSSCRKAVFLSSVRFSFLAPESVNHGFQLLDVCPCPGVAGGNDENDSRDMGAFIRGCDELKRRTGATVLVVHHSGKDETKG